MLKAMLLSFCLCAGITSFASTQALFSKDKRNVVVIIQGDRKDLDAINLFNSMNVAMVGEGDMFKKHDLLSDRTSEQLIDLTCKVSQRIQNLGSCTLIVYSSPYALIYPDVGHLLFGVNDQSLARRFAKHFNISDAYGQIFRSTNGQLNISAATDAEGQVNSFTVVYRLR